MSAAAVAQEAGEYKFVRALSGPGGKVSSDDFVLDEVRSRFVYPADRSMVVYFEWNAKPGDHVLSAVWKDPTGKTAFISSDVKIATPTERLRSYWTYYLNADLASGFWTVEIRSNGAPVGTHSFEIVVPEKPAPAPVVETPKPKFPTLDELYKLSSSVVFVHKIDANGRRVDTSSGFMYSDDLIATTFEAIDSAASLQLELSTGKILQIEEIAAWNRVGDWVLLRVPAGTAPVLERASANTPPVPVGGRLIVFNVENGKDRVIGGIDLAGRRACPGASDCYLLSPSPAKEAAGGPILNDEGRVVGMLIGNLVPGSRISRADLALDPELWMRLNNRPYGLPVQAIGSPGSAKPETLKKMIADGTLTPPLSQHEAFVSGASSKRQVGDEEENYSSQHTSVFSRKDAAVWVSSVWARRKKTAEGMLSAKVHDEMNRVRVNVAGKKIKVSNDLPKRFSFQFSPAVLQPGTYRVDVLWNDVPVWRTFIVVKD